eukprot:6047642-Pyramimonas_sp.AAC.1
MYEQEGRGMDAEPIPFGSSSSPRLSMEALLAQAGQEILWGLGIRVAVRAAGQECGPCYCDCPP